MCNKLFRYETAFKTHLKTHEQALVEKGLGSDVASE